VLILILDFEIVQSLQIGHGGWSDSMFECLGSSKFNKIPLILFISLSLSMFSWYCDWY
jgi:hypothetical protein